jgi:hypothetical protein
VDYVCKVVRNVRAFDEQWEPPLKVSDLRQAYLSTKARIGRALGLSGARLAAILGVSESSVHRLWGRTKDALIQGAKLTIRITLPVVAREGRLAGGVFDVNVCGDDFSELLLIRCADSKAFVVKSEDLAGKVKVYGG